MSHNTITLYWGSINADFNTLFTLSTLTNILRCIWRWVPAYRDILSERVKPLSSKVAVTAETAERIGSKVARLDEEIRRVKSSVERVGQTMELKVGDASNCPWYRLTFVIIRCPSQTYIPLSNPGTGKQQLVTVLDRCRSLPKYLLAPLQIWLWCVS